MNLHTHGLIDACAQLLAQTEWRRWIIRFVIIKSKDTAVSKAHSPRYVAIGLLSPQRWTKGFRAAHTLVSDKNNGLLVGKTFQAKGMTVSQNRLSLLRLPGFLIPSSIRKLIPRARSYWSLWVIEIYTFNAVNKTGKMGHYGTFIEIAPAPRKFHSRHKLGIEMIWRSLGRSERFKKYLSSQEIPVKPHRRDSIAAITAQVTGWIFSVPTLYLFSMLARRAAASEEVSDTFN